MAGKIVDNDGKIGVTPRLTSSIEPSTATKGSTGDVAFKDAVSLVVLSWALLILLMWSLRHHII